MYEDAEDKPRTIEQLARDVAENHHNVDGVCAGCDYFGEWPCDEWHLAQYVLETASK